MAINGNVVEIPIKATIVEYQSSLDKFKKALSLINPGQMFSQSISKAINSAQNQINKLPSSFKVTSQKGVDKAFGDLEGVAQSLLHINELFQQTKAPDINLGALGDEVKQLVLQADGLRESINTSMNDGIRDAVSASSDLNAVFKSLGVNVTTMTEKQGMDALIKGLNQATRAAEGAQKAYDGANQALEDMQRKQAKLQANPLSTTEGFIDTRNALSSVNTKGFDFSQIRAIIDAQEKELSHNIVRGKNEGGKASFFATFDEEVKRLEQTIDSSNAPDKIREFVDRINSSMKNLVFLDGTSKDASSYFRIDEMLTQAMTATPQSLQGAFSQIETIITPFIQGLSESIRGKFLSLQADAQSGQLTEGGITGFIDAILNALPAKAASLKSELTKVGEELSEASKTVQEKLAILQNAKGKVDTLTGAQEQYNQIISQMEGRLTKLRQQLDEMETRLKQYAEQGVGNVKDLSRQGGDQGDDAYKNAAKNIRVYSDEVDQVRKREQMLGKVSGLVQRWFSIYTAVRMVRKAINNVISTVKELDKTITNIAIVTDMSQSDLWAQMGTYTETARRFATSISGVYEVAQLYYQQGLQSAQVTEMTEATLKLARIAGMGYADATNYMTNAVRSFKMEMSEAQRVTDVYSAISASAATSSSELAEAMSKTASSAEAVGSSFENTTAMMAVMIEATREAPQNIGSAMKSIISRYGEMTADPTATKDSEGEEMSLNRVDKALKTVGITLQTAEGQFRDFDDVIMDLAEKWDTIDKNTQRYIATIMAGNRQQSRFLALVSSYDRLKELSAIAADSEDASQLQFIKTLDSVDAKLTQLKTNFQSIYVSSGVENLYKSLLDIGNNIVKTFGTLHKVSSLPVLAITKLISSFSTLAMVVGTAFKLVSQHFNERMGIIQGKVANTMQEIHNDAENQETDGAGPFERAWKNAIEGIKNAWIGFKNLVNGTPTPVSPAPRTSPTNNNTNLVVQDGSGTREAKGNTVSVAAARRGLRLAAAGSALTLIGSSIDPNNLFLKGTTTGAGGILSGIGMGMAVSGPAGWITGILTALPQIISAISIFIDDASEQAERAREAAEKANNEAIESRNKYKQATSAYEAYQKARDAQYDSAEAAQEFKDAAEELAQIMPELVSGYDDQGDVILNLTGMENKLAEARQAAADATLAAAQAQMVLNDKDIISKRGQFTYDNDIYDWEGTQGSEYDEFVQAFRTFQWDAKDATSIYQSLIDLQKMYNSLTAKSNSELTGTEAYMRGVLEWFFTTNRTKADEIISLYGDRSQLAANIVTSRQVQRLSANNTGLNKYNESKNSLNLISNFLSQKIIEDTSVEKWGTATKDFNGSIKTINEWINDTTDAYQAFYGNLSSTNQEVLDNLLANTDSYSVNDVITKLGIGKDDLVYEILHAVYDPIEKATRDRLTALATSKGQQDNEILSTMISKVSTEAEAKFVEALVEDYTTLFNTNTDKAGLLLEGRNNLFNLIEGLDSKQKAAALKTINNGDLNSITGIFDIIYELRNSGINVTQELENSLYNGIVVNLTSEITSYIHNVAKGAEDLSKAISNASKGMDLKDALAMADKLGVSITDFSFRAGKYYFNDFNKIEEAYNKKLNEERERLREQYQSSYQTLNGLEELADPTGQHEQLSELSAPEAPKPLREFTLKPPEEPKWELYATDEKRQAAQAKYQQMLNDYNSKKQEYDAQQEQYIKQYEKDYALYADNVWYEFWNQQDSRKGKGWREQENNINKLFEDTAFLTKMSEQGLNTTEIKSYVQEFYEDTDKQTEETFLSWLQRKYGILYDEAFIQVQKGLEYEKNAAYITSGNIRGLLESLGLTERTNVDKVVAAASQGDYTTLVSNGLDEYASLLVETYNKVIKEVHTSFSNGVLGESSYIDVTDINKNELDKAYNSTLQYDEFGNDGTETWLKAIKDNKGQIVAYYTDINENTIGWYLDYLDRLTGITEETRAKMKQEAYDKLNKRNAYTVFTGFSDKESLNATEYAELMTAIYGENRDNWGMKDWIANSRGEYEFTQERREELMTEIEERAKQDFETLPLELQNAYLASKDVVENFDRDAKVSAISNLLKNKDNLKYDDISKAATAFGMSYDEFKEAYTKTIGGVLYLNLPELNKALEDGKGAFANIDEAVETTQDEVAKSIDSYNSNLSTAVSYITQGTTKWSDLESFQDSFKEITGRNASIDELFSYDELLQSWTINEAAFGEYQEGLRNKLKELGVADEKIDKFLKQATKDIEAISIEDFYTAENNTIGSQAYLKLASSVKKAAKVRAASEVASNSQLSKLDDQQKEGVITKIANNYTNDMLKDIVNGGTEAVEAWASTLEPGETLSREQIKLAYNYKNQVAMDRLSTVAELKVNDVIDAATKNMLDDIDGFKFTKTVNNQYIVTKLGSIEDAVLQAASDILDNAANHTIEEVNKAAATVWNSQNKRDTAAYNLIANGTGMSADDFTALIGNLGVKLDNNQLQTWQENGLIGRTANNEIQVLNAMGLLDTINTLIGDGAASVDIKNTVEYAQAYKTLVEAIIASSAGIGDIAKEQATSILTATRGTSIAFSVFETAVEDKDSWNEFVSNIKDLGADYEDGQLKIGEQADLFGIYAEVIKLMQNNKENLQLINADFIQLGDEEVKALTSVNDLLSKALSEGVNAQEQEQIKQYAQAHGLQDTIKWTEENGKYKATITNWSAWTGMFLKTIISDSAKDFDTAIQQAQTALNQTVKGTSNRTEIDTFIQEYNNLIKDAQITDFTQIYDYDEEKHAWILSEQAYMNFLMAKAQELEAGGATADELTAFWDQAAEAARSNIDIEKYFNATDKSLAEKDLSNSIKAYYTEEAAQQRQAASPYGAYAEQMAANFFSDEWIKRQSESSIRILKGGGQAAVDEWKKLNPGKELTPELAEKLFKYPAIVAQQVFDDIHKNVGDTVSGTSVEILQKANYGLQAIGNGQYIITAIGDLDAAVNHVYEEYGEDVKNTTRSVADINKNAIKHLQSTDKSDSLIRILSSGAGIGTEELINGLTELGIEVGDHAQKINEWLGDGTLQDLGGGQVAIPDFKKFLYRIINLTGNYDWADETSIAFQKMYAAYNDGWIELNNYTSNSITNAINDLINNNQNQKEFNFGQLKSIKNKNVYNQLKQRLEEAGAILNENGLLTLTDNFNLESVIDIFKDYKSDLGLTDINIRTIEDSLTNYRTNIQSLIKKGVEGTLTAADKAILGLYGKNHDLTFDFKEGEGDQKGYYKLITNTLQIDDLPEYLRSAYINALGSAAQPYLDTLSKASQMVVTGTSSATDIASFIAEAQKLGVTVTEEDFKFNKLTGNLQLNMDKYKAYREAVKTQLKADNIGLSDELAGKIADYQTLSTILDSNKLISYVTGSKTEQSTENMKNALTMVKDLKGLGNDFNVTTILNNLTAGGETAVKQMQELAKMFNWDITDEQYTALNKSALEKWSAAAQQLDSLAVGSYVGDEDLKQILIDAEYKFKDGTSNIIESTGDLTAAQLAIYEKMADTNRATVSELNAQYTKYINERNRAQQGMLTALQTGGQMDSGQLQNLADSMHILVENVWNDPDAFGLEDIGAGYTEIVDFNKFATAFNLDPNTKLYQKYWNEYVNSVINRANEATSAVMSEATNIVNAKTGDKINISYLMAGLKDHNGKDYSEDFVEQLRGAGVEVDEANDILTITAETNLTELSNILLTAANTIEMTDAQKAQLLTEANNVTKHAGELFEQAISGSLNPDEALQLDTWAKAQGIEGLTWKEEADGTYSLITARIQDGLSPAIQQIINKAVNSQIDSTISSISSLAGQITNGTTNYADMANTLELMEKYNISGEAYTWNKDLSAYTLNLNTFYDLMDAQRQELIDKYGEGNIDFINKLINNSIFSQLIDSNILSNFLSGGTSSKENDQLQSQLTTYFKTKLRGNKNTVNVEDIAQESAQRFMDAINQGGAAGLKAMDELEQASDFKFTEAQRQAVYNRQLNTLTEAMSLVDNLALGTRVESESMRELLDKLGYDFDANGVVTAVGEMIDVYTGTYERMKETAGVTLGQLNTQYAKILNERDKYQTAAVTALDSGASMTYDALGDLLASLGVSLEAVVNNMGAYGLASLGAGQLRIADFEKFAARLGLDPNSESYVTALKAYNDSLIEYDNKVKNNILNEVKGLASAKPGDTLNLTYFASKFSNELLKGLIGDNGTVTNGLVKLNDSANIKDVYTNLLTFMSKSNNFNQRDIAQLKDEFTTKFVTSFTDGIKKAFEGTFSETEMLDFIELVKTWGISDLDTADFTRTEKGLQLSIASSWELYNSLVANHNAAAEIVLDNLIESLTKANEQYETIAGTLTRINTLNNLIKDADSNGESTRKEQYKAELKVAKEIAKVRATTKDDSLDFMNQKMPDVLSNPQNVAKSLVGALSTWNNAWKTSTKYFDFGTGKWTKGKGMMGMDSFYNLANMMNQMAGMAGTEMVMAGVKIDGSATAMGELVSKAFDTMSVLEDGSTVVNLGAIGMDFKTGTKEMTAGFEAGFKEMAKDQVDMLDHIIALVEVLAAVEQLGDLTGAGVTIDLDDIVKVEGDGRVFTSGFEKWQKYITEHTDINDKDNFNQDLYNALQIEIDGQTLESIIKQNADAWDKTDAAILNGFYQAVKSGNLSEDNIWESIKQSLAAATNLQGKDLKINVPGKGEVIIHIANGMVLEADKDGKWNVGGHTFDDPDEAARAAILTSLGDVKLSETLKEGKNNIYAGKLTLSEDLELTVSIDKNNNIKYWYRGKSYATQEQAVWASFVYNNPEYKNKEIDYSDQKFIQYQYRVGVRPTIVASANNAEKIKLTSDQKKAIVDLGDNAFEKLQDTWANADTDEKKLEFVATYGFSLDKGGKLDPEVLKTILELNGIESKTLDITTNLDTNGSDVLNNLLLTGEGSATLEIKSKVTGPGKTLLQLLGEVFGITLNGTEVPPADSNNSSASNENTDNTAQENAEEGASAVDQATEQVNEDLKTGATEATTTSAGWLNPLMNLITLFIPKGQAFNHMIQLANDALASTHMPEGLRQAKAAMLSLFGIELDSTEAKYALENTSKGMEELAGTPIAAIYDGLTKVQQSLATLAGVGFDTAAGGVDSVQSSIATLAEASFGTISEGLSNIKSALAGWSFPSIPSSTGSSKGPGGTIPAPQGQASGARGNVGPAQATGTLMGELGPELYVSGGRYHIAGQNGAEFVDLPDDAIVFNHLQTKKLLQTGAAGRGTAITNERNAVAFAKGTGPAMASASAVLATLKQLRSMWQRLAEMNLSQLAGMGGGGGGGGGGQFTKDLERWFNLLQKIARLEKLITHEQQLQSKLESDRLINGSQIYLSQQREAQSLQQVINHNRELLSLQQGRYQERIDELQRSNAFFRTVYTIDENGALQLRNRENSQPGDNFQPITYNGREYSDAYAFLAEVASMNPDTGEVKYKPGEQLAMLRAVFGDELVEQYSSYDSSGKKTSNDEERLRAFFDRVDGLKEEVTTLQDSVEETENNILEGQQNLSEILQKYVDNQLAVEQEVVGAIEAREQTAIDEAQKERDAFSKAQEALVEGLTSQLDKERKMYERQQASEDLNRMRRQLAILQRSGGSQSQIRSLQDQINSASQDAYFNAQQDQIDAIKEASDLQLERMDTQIELMTETLEYQKENGLFWPEVTQIMQQSPEEIMNFVQTYTPKYRSDSELQIEEHLRQLRNIVEQWTTRRDDPNALDVNSNVTETPDDVYQMYSNWYTNTAYRQFSTTLFSENYAERDKLNQDAINAFYETWNRTGDLRSAQDAAAAVFQSHEDRLSESDRNNHAWQIEQRNNPPGGGTGGSTGSPEGTATTSAIKFSFSGGQADWYGVKNGSTSQVAPGTYSLPVTMDQKYTNMWSYSASSNNEKIATVAGGDYKVLKSGGGATITITFTRKEPPTTNNSGPTILEEDTATDTIDIFDGEDTALLKNSKTNTLDTMSAKKDYSHRLTNLLSLLNSNTAANTPELNSLLSTWSYNTTPDSLTSLFNSASALSTLRQLQQSTGQQTTNIVNINNPVIKDEDDIQIIKDTIEDYLGSIAKKSGAYMSVR